MEVTEPGILEKSGEKKLAGYLKEVYKPSNKILKLVWGPVVNLAIRIMDDFLFNLLPEKVKESIREPLGEFVAEL